MSFLKSTGQVRLAVGAILGLLLSGIVAPTKGWASCGDYVQRATKPGDPGLNMSQNDHSSPAIPGEPRFPCSGPNCSRGSQEPAAPVSTIPPGPTHWALGQPPFTIWSREPVPISQLA